MIWTNDCADLVCVAVSIRVHVYHVCEKRFSQHVVQVVLHVSLSFCSCLVSKETSHGCRAEPCLCAPREARDEKNDHPPHLTGKYWPPLVLSKNRQLRYTAVSIIIIRVKGFPSIWKLG